MLLYNKYNKKEDTFQEKIKKLTKLQKKAVTKCNGFRKLIKSDIADVLSVVVVLIIKICGLPCEGVNVARVDLGGGGVIDEGEGRAVVVGDGLAGGCLHRVAYLGAAVCVAQHVDVAVVEACQHDGLGVHHGGDEAEELGLEAGVVDFKVGFQRLAAESALGGVFQLTHIA